MTALLLSCGSNVDKDSHTTSGKIDSIEKLELLLPSIPDYINRSHERAAYVALHFWDEMDWRNHGLSLDTAFMEQNFVNYLSVLPLADINLRIEAVASLMHGAESDSSAYKFLTYVAERYLADPNSPMRSEDLYVIFLNEFMKSPYANDAQKLRYEYQLEVANKNRPGSIASDFRLTDKNHKKSTLHKAVGGTNQSLIVFYDPDCEHCKEIMSELAHWPIPDDVRVLAIDVTGDQERFETSEKNFPQNWHASFAADPIEDEDRYVFPALPSIYLLDNNARVILKDATLGAIAASLAK